MIYRAWYCRALVSGLANYNGLITVRTTTTVHQPVIMQFSMVVVSAARGQLDEAL